MAECRVPECEADTAGNRKGLCRRHYGTSQQILSRWVKALASGDRNRYPTRVA